MIFSHTLLPPDDGAAMTADDTALLTLAECLVEALKRAREWTWFHYDRAQARKLPHGADTLARAANALQGFEEITEERGIRADLAWIIRICFRAVSVAAINEPAWPFLDTARHQMLELDGSNFYILLENTIPHIFYIHKKLSNGSMNAHEAMREANKTMLDACGYPPHESEVSS